MKIKVSAIKIFLFVAFFITISLIRLWLDQDSDPYKLAVSTVHHSDSVRDFVDGQVQYTILIGASNTHYTSSGGGEASVDMKCASRLFLVRGKNIEFVEVLMRLDAHPSSHWRVRDVLNGWSDSKKDRCRPENP